MFSIKKIYSRIKLRRKLSCYQRDEHIDIGKGVMIFTETPKRWGGRRKKTSN